MFAINDKNKMESNRHTPFDSSYRFLKFARHKLLVLDLQSFVALRIFVFAELECVTVAVDGFVEMAAFTLKLSDTYVLVNLLPEFAQRSAIDINRCYHDCKTTYRMLFARSALT